MESSGPRRQFMFGAFGMAGAGLAPVASAAQQESPSSPQFDVRRFGAAGDGKKLETAALQAAIDACAAAGGTVYFPSGTYLSGTLILRSRVRLFLDTGAVLLGSSNLDHYPPQIPAFRSYTDNYTEKSLLYAEGAEQIAIHGRGVIDGQGGSFRGPYKVRPYMLRVISCRHVSVTGITLRNSPMWVQHYLACDDVHIEGLTVHSRVNQNNDGINIDCCRRVRIANCDISSGDDAIVLKSTADRTTRDVVITNCVVSSHCNGLKMGTETNGGFENITIANCTVYDTRLSGLTLQIVDGGVLDRVAVTNIAMQNVGAPIFIRLGDRARPFREGGLKPGVGRLRNAQISNITAVGGGNIGCAIAGLEGHHVENVTLDNIRLTFNGGGTKEDAARQVPEERDKYPEFQMFGRLPAYGFYCRHVRNLRLNNIETLYATPDQRPGLVCDDVDALEVAGCAFGPPQGGGPAIRLVNTRDAFLHGCRAAPGTSAWVQLSGAQTANVTLVGNELSAAASPLEAAQDVPKQAVFLDANRVRK